MQQRMGDVGVLFLRALMGAGIAYHGYGKVFGGMMGRFTEGVAQMGFPAPELFAWAAALSEFAGGLLLVVGFQTRLAALAVFGTMSVAAFIAHRADPFQVKEMALAYWTIAGALACIGGGAYSFDAKLAARRRA